MSFYRSLFGLTVDAWLVMQLRLLKLARGGTAALGECAMMCNEKLGALLDEQLALACGETLPGLVARRRRYVAANVRRLTNA